ncbi:MAG: N-acetylmuramic acid 6-phosphate etherase [candidate division WS1 bacterium]|jgi:N-acetylmuramic acid 6-phosphate etherase|nr:N-acetylmuramic acid 6-phosphate etherase [candidate division WS1 bacterium]
MSGAIRELTTEGRHPRAQGLDELSPLALVTLMNEVDAEVIPAVRAATPAIAAAIEAIAERLRAGGRMIYFGAGTSGRLGMLDAAECQPTFDADESMVLARMAGGTEAFRRAAEGVEDSPAAGATDASTLGVRRTDAVIGLAASGRTPYVLGALAHAREAGALTVSVACVQGSETGRAAEIAIEVVTGPEILSGSTRLKAGTAQKMVLNMLSTGVMTQLGRVHDHLMVEMRATNAKLRARALSIVAEIAGVPDMTARRAIEACRGALKPACLVAAKGLTPDEAAALLAECGGRLRTALARAEAGPKQA